MKRITIAQLRVLRRMLAEEEKLGQPEVAYWDCIPAKNLVRAGLIERCDHFKDYGGGVSFTTFMARITPLGRETLMAVPRWKLD